jgi:hypothetical protein
MSLLTKTISSFFPNEVKPAFVEAPWFTSNYKLQLAVLRLCSTGFACVLFCNITDPDTFKKHVMCCMRNFIDPDYTVDSPHYRFVEFLAAVINDGNYLLTRKWFCDEPRRHVNVYLIELNGCSSLINAVAGDFDEHIEKVMDTIIRCYEIYGTNTRNMIHEGLCEAFFTQSTADVDEDEDDYDNDNDSADDVEDNPDDADTAALA